MAGLFQKELGMMTEVEPKVDLSAKIGLGGAALRVSKPTLLHLVQDKDGKLRSQLARYRTELTPDRFLRALLTEVRQNPRLLECTQSSFQACIFDMASLGLEPGPLGDAYLVPFRDNKKGTTECTLILGYRGLIRLARRSGEIVSLTAEVVHQNDEFDFEFGSNKFLRHKPVLDEPGEVIAAYAIATYLKGGFDFKVLSTKQVESYRKRSKNAGGADSPWTNDWNSMAMKTGIRRLSPFLPLTPEAQNAIVVDEQRELGIQKESVEGMVEELPDPEPTNAQVVADAAPLRVATGEAKS